MEQVEAGEKWIGILMVYAAECFGICGTSGSFGLCTCSSFAVCIFCLRPGSLALLVGVSISSSCFLKAFLLYIQLLETRNPLLSNLTVSSSRSSGDIAVRYAKVARLTLKR